MSDDIIMNMYKIQTNMQELARVSQSQHEEINKLAEFFKQFYVANNNLMIDLNRRIGILEGKIK